MRSSLYLAGGFGWAVLPADELLDPVLEDPLLDDPLDRLPLDPLPEVSAERVVDPAVDGDVVVYPSFVIRPCLAIGSLDEPRTTTTTGVP